MFSSLIYSLSRPDRLLQDMAVLVLYFSQEEGLVLRGKGSGQTSILHTIGVKCLLLSTGAVQDRKRGESENIY